MEPITITLAHPITIGAETIESLQFARPLCAGDMRGVPVGNMCFEHITLVAGRMCGQPPKVMESLQGEDFTAVVDLMTRFLASGRKTGSSA